MNEQFNYDRFLTLAGCELVNYVEPFLTTWVDSIPESVYGPLQSTIASLDEEHTVYALEICMILKPGEFADHAVAFLSNTDAAVCCAAYRVLTNLSRTYMDADLARKIAATPIVDLFTRDVPSGKRSQVGTNEEFLRNLVERREKTAT